MEKVPASHRDLLSDKTKAFAFLATTMTDGTPQVSPVWFNVDGEHIVINTAEGRVKDRNMSSRPYVALTMVDPNDPYRYLLLRGSVVKRIHEGADEHISTLSRKYLGEDWDIPAGEIRVMYKVVPEHVFASS